MKKAIALAAVSIQLCCALLASGMASAQAAAGDAYCISNVNPSAFPTMQATLRIVTRDGDVAEPPTNLLVYENGAATIDVKPKREDGPMHYVFIVDGGRASTAQKEAMKRAMGLLVEKGAFRNGLDDVAVRVLANTSGNSPSGRTEERLAWKSNDADLRTLLKNDIFPKNTAATRGLDGLKDGVDAIKQRVGIGTGVAEASVIIFITNRIESATSAVVDAQGWADLAHQEHIPIYAFQTGVGTQLQAPVIALASAARFVQLTGNFDAAVSAAYDRMSAQRVRYALTYTSTSPETNARRISINAPNVFGVCTGNDQYTMNVPLPSVSIDSSLPGQLRLNAESPSYPIVATISWPLSSTKALRSATLLIDKVKKQQKDKAQLAGNVDSINFSVIEKDFSGRDKVEIIIEVVDELGRTVQSTPRIIEIDRTPAAQPTPTPEPPTATSPLIYVAIGVGSLALLASGAAIVLLARRQSRGSNQNSGRWVRGGQGGTSPSPAAASLTVIDGPTTRVGERIALVKPKYIIGRQNADVAFFTDASNSTVSRTHCTITREADSYWIVDNVSSNGTRVNSHRILPNERTALRHGDTITLGDVKRNGVQLQFAVEDRTQVVRPGGPDGGTSYKTR